MHICGDVHNYLDLLRCVFCLAAVSSSLPIISSTSTVADPGEEVNPVMSPNQGDGFLSPTHHHHSEGPTSARLLPHSSSHVASPACPHLHSSFQVHPRLQPSAPVRPGFHPSHRRASESLLPSSSRTSNLHPESSSKNKEKALSSPQKKAPVKQMWEDVSVLPKIPKIKRESVAVTNGLAHRSSSGSRGYGLPERGMNSFAGDKGRQQSVDQHKGRNEGQARRQRTDPAASSSSAFSNSFSSSSSAASSHYHSSSSSSATAVSFRINSSGNSWHSRRLNVRPTSCGGSALPDAEKGREEAARKKQLRKDKQMLLASRNSGGTKEEDSSNMYDPFNPTLSESCSSDDEAESTSLDNSSQCATQDDEPSGLVKEEPETHSSDDGFSDSSKTHDEKVVKQEASGEDAEKKSSPANPPQENTKVKTEWRDKDSDTENQSLRKIKVESDPGINSTPERKVFPANAHTGETKVDCSLVKREKIEGEQNGSRDASSAAPVVCKTEPCTSSPVPSKKRSRTEMKDNTKSSLKDPKEAPQESSSSESDRRRRREPHVPDRNRQTKENKEQPSSKQHRRKGRSSSDSSHSDSDMEQRRKQRVRSQSKERRRSR